MRASCLIACSFVSGAIACGGSSDKPTLLDAAPPDTATVCSQSGTVTTQAPVNFGTGGGQAQGTVPMGDTELTVTAVVTSTPTTGLLIVMVNNAGVFGAGATAAGRFEKPPTPGTYPMDPDANVGFGIDFVDGITTNTDGTVSINPKQVAILDTTAGGTVKIDSWTPGAAQGGTSTIAATFTNAKFIGHNVLPTGALDQTGNGCDITLQNLQFTNLTVKWQTAAFPANLTGAPAVASGVAPQVPRSFAPRTLDGAATARAELSVAP
ncbi:MAG TPA: hypothetical protein VHW23_07850 [Kofleriaceae bacterium]|nr:hypothetical protein [Kofleriaceae bacterium]